MSTADAAPSWTPRAVPTLATLASAPGVCSCCRCVVAVPRGCFAHDLSLVIRRRQGVAYTRLRHDAKDPNSTAAKAPVLNDA